MKKLRLYLNKHLEGGPKGNQSSLKGNKSNNIPDNFWSGQWNKYMIIRMLIFIKLFFHAKVNLSKQYNFIKLIQC